MIENIPTEKLYDEDYKKIIDKMEFLLTKIQGHDFELSMVGTGSLTYTVFDQILSPFKNIRKIRVGANYFLIKLKKFLINHNKIRTSYVNYVWVKDNVLNSPMLYPVRKVEYPWVIFNGQLFQKSKILDVGSGPSMFPMYLSSLGNEVVSIDNDEVLMKYVCPKLAEWCETKVEYRIGDATKINFDDNTFDRVFCVSVLEHLEEEFGNRDQTNFHTKNLDIKAINEMLRVLKPGGLLVMTVDWSENLEDHRSYKLDDIYNRMLKDYQKLLVKNEKPIINWNELKKKHLDAEKKFPPYNYLVEGWAMGIVLEKK